MIGFSSMGRLQVLSAAEVDQFIDLGWVAVEDCFSREQALAATRQWAADEGLCLERPREWGFEARFCALRQPIDGRTFAPKAYAVLEDLVGEGRIYKGRWRWNAFVVNACLGDPSLPRIPPLDVDYPGDPTGRVGWHVDGDFFTHFLDSPEKGLVTIQYFTDVEPGGGPTVVSEDSYPEIARYLAEHPEGVPPQQIDPGVKSRVPFRRQRALPGPAGTVLFLHPFLLHASSPNTSGRARVASLSNVRLAEPMRFDDWGNASVVERSIIQALGGVPFQFQPTGPRLLQHPDRSNYSVT